MVQASKWGAEDMVRPSGWEGPMQGNANYHTPSPEDVDPSFYFEGINEAEAAAILGIPEPHNQSRENREEALEKVSGCVLSDRNKEYGDPEDNFADIADMANVAFGHKLSQALTPADVAIIMSIVKIARYKTSPYQLDHLVDLAGYAVCGYACVKREVTD